MILGLIFLVGVAILITGLVAVDGDWVMLIPLWIIASSSFASGVFLGEFLR